MSSLSERARQAATNDRNARWDTDLGSHEELLDELADEIERLQDVVDADNRRFAWLADADGDYGPVVEGFAGLLDTFWDFLGDAIRERIGEENDSPDERGTREDRIKAFRAMVDAAMAAEKARSE